MTKEGFYHRQLLLMSRASQRRATRELYNSVDSALWPHERDKLGRSPRGWLAPNVIDEPIDVLHRLFRMISLEPADLDECIL